MAASSEQNAAYRWCEGLVALPPREAAREAVPRLRLLRQDYEQLELRQSVIRTPMRIGTRQFGHGLGTHSVGHIRVCSPESIERFSAFVGVDQNDRTAGGRGSVVFSVKAAGRTLYESAILRGGQEAERVEVNVGDVRVIDLHVGDGGDGPSCDHADWADARITTSDGKTTYLDEMKLEAAEVGSRYPLSFSFDGQRSDDVLGAWRSERKERELDGGRTKTGTVWADPDGGLRVQWDAIRFPDFPAVEWLLYFENTGQQDTSIIEDVQALSLTLKGRPPYRLHRTNGAPSNPTDFEAEAVGIDSRHSAAMGAGGGRSSNKDLPFFKIETGEESYIVAVGWSGQWAARVECQDDSALRVTAGMEKTHFRLRPGERVRTPRMLVLRWDGDTDECNAQFRQLIYRHYAATRSGKKPLPTLFCNTCFTRGGAWLNECNAGNQISLIKAYAPLGLEALLTDAGWFEGGWPKGAGNWTPRKDAYPDGMAPVAEAAKENGMIYGLWFEPERVVHGTWVHRNHPEWCLGSTDGPQDTYLLNFGLREVQDYFFGIVKGFMELPGFRMYRQDFNMSPLPYWRRNDTPDRQGITEMKYIQGLYDYWDRIGETWPDSLREECASGGRRTDLETVMRFHIHQKTDYWFDNEVDQASIWGLSQYLPNNVFVAHVNRTDEYSFHSTMASSLCLGWTADGAGFDLARARKLVGRYREVRHLLVGAWYSLLPYSRSSADWIASQYHRPDLGEGMILVFRRPESRYLTAEVALRGLRAEAIYELRWDRTGETVEKGGGELMRLLRLTMPEPHRSELIVYRRR